MKKIDPKELETIYLNNPVEKAAKKFNISVPTLMKYLKHFKIKKKGRGRKKGWTKFIL